MAMKRAFISLSNEVGITKIKRERIIVATWVGDKISFTLDTSQVFMFDEKVVGAKDLFEDL